jgi:hypothetical protein
MDSSLLMDNNNEFSQGTSLVVDKNYFSRNHPKTKEV